MEETTTSPSPFSKLIERIALVVMMVFAFAFPVLFTQLTIADVFEFPKWTLTVLVAFLMVILAGLYMIFQEKIIIPARDVTIPATLFLVAIILSILFSSTNIIVMLQGKGGLLIAFILIFLSSLVLLRENAKKLIVPLMASALILSLFQVLAFFEVLSRVIKNPLFASKQFTPLGSQTVLACFLAVIIPVTIVYALRAKEVGQKFLFFVIGGIEAIALVFAIAQVMPNQPANPKFLPFSSGWSIAVDQLKLGKTALVGVGPDNFLAAFNQFRPVILNQTTSWFLKYNASSNEWLTIFTTMGLIGLVSFALLVLALIRKALAARKESVLSATIGIGLAVTLVLITFIPANTGLLFLFFVLGLIVVGASNSDGVAVPNKIASIITALPCLALGLAGLFFLSRLALAEHAFGQSLKYASENRGTETYNAQIQALSLNGYNVKYRLAYSATNLALANSLASKQELTDDDKQKITQLVSQGIREGKNAISLDPVNASNWLNLAQIYRQLINFAQGADQWALSSYIQAIRLDNSNPQLRIDLGGLLFALNRQEDAIDQFKQTIVLKPDYANAYYNLSNIYKQQKQYVQAYAAMQNVVSLIDVNSADHDKALDELNQLQALLPPELRSASGAASARESQLTTPPPTPSPKPAGEVKFDQNQQKDLEPPVNENGFGEELEKASPSPEASVQPSASPVPSASPAAQP